jgi:hypothetical protein
VSGGECEREPIRVRSGDRPFAVAYSCVEREYM